MSHEGALSFVQRMKTDQGFRDQIGAAGDDGARLELIKGAGFDVDENDRDFIVKELATSDEQLSDAELAGVTGGADVPTGGCKGLGPGI